MQLQLSGVGFTHADGHVALRELHLQVAQGEQIAIIGPSGAGKTSLLRLLGCQIKPSLGQFQLGTQQPWQHSPRALRALRSRIGLIHQQPPLPPKQRVITAVLAGRLGQWSLLHSLRNLLSPQDRQGAEAALARLDLADKLFQRCDQLSGGQLQRVGIARVLYQQAELMLADEPVSAMDPHLAQHTLRSLCAAAAEQGSTLLASLHTVDLALALFPRIIGLRDGRIQFDLPAQAVSPEQLSALYANERLASPASTALNPLRIARC